MKKNTIKYVGLDTHKSNIVIALADADREGEIRNYGTTSRSLSENALLPQLFVITKK